MDLGKPEKRLHIRRTVHELPPEPVEPPATADPVEQSTSAPDSAGT